MLAGLGRVQGNIEDESVAIYGRRHDLAFEGDAVVERRQFDHPIVVMFKNSEPIADLEGRVHEGGFADLGRDIADLDIIGGRKVGRLLGRSPDASARRKSDQSQPTKSHESMLLGSKT